MTPEELEIAKAACCVGTIWDQYEGTEKFNEMVGIRVQHLIELVHNHLQHEQPKVELEKEMEHGLIMANSPKLEQKEKKPAGLKENERIRQMIGNTLRDAVLSERISETSYKEMSDYLERQKEQNRGIKYVYPIFKVGDTIKPKAYNESHQISKIKDDNYVLDNGFTFPIVGQDVWEIVEPKPAEWSEEDEKCIKDIIICLDYLKREDTERQWNGDRNVNPKRYDDMIAKLKSLRPQPKAELTLLDENIISAAVAFVEQNDHFNCWRGIDKHTVIKAFRSLRPHWKPSEYTLSLVKKVVDGEMLTGVEQMAMGTLYEQFKKL